MRRVQHHQHRDLRVVPGREAPVRGIIGLLFVRQRLLALAGAGFAARLIAGHIARLVAAGQRLAIRSRHIYASRQQLAHGGAGLGREPLPLHFRLHVFNDIPVRVQHLLHHVRLYQISAVDDGAGRCDHLDGRGGRRLAEGGGGQLHGPHSFQRDVLCRSLVVHVDARFLVEAEGLHIIAERLRPHHLPQRDIVGVARAVQAAEEVQRAVVGVRAPHGAARHGDGALAGVRGVQVRRAGVQRSRSRDDLEHRAGVVQVGHRLVAPLRPLRGIFRVRPFVFIRNGRDLCRQRLVRNGVRVLQVVVRHRRHGQDRPRVHVHHDAHRAVFHMILVHGVLQVFFQCALDAGVQRQHQAVAVLGVIGRLVGAVWQIVSPGVLHAHHAPGGALERIVVIALDAQHAVAVRVHKADDR